MSGQVYEYAGVNRSRGHVVGRTSDDPAVFVEAKYKAGWCELLVWPAGERDTGSPVGEINDVGYDGVRTWWAKEAS